MAELIYHEIVARGSTNLTYNGINLEDCTLKTCPIEYAQVRYVPTLAGNVILLGIFAFLALSQLIMGIRYKTWGYMAGMLSGLLLEIIGYVGRVQMHANIFKSNPFLIYLVCLTIGPAFLTAAIYLCLGRLVVVHGPHLSRLKPGTYTIIFVSCDFVSLLLQAAGGAIASIASTQSSQQMGVHIMVAGLVFQVVSLLIFSCLCTDFFLRVRRNSMRTDPRWDDLRESFKFRAFQYSLAIATLAIFVRSVYRVAELQEGFNGAIANNELIFMILEGPMIIIAVGLLTIFHPGISFGGRWHDATWSFSSKKQAKIDKQYKQTIQMDDMHDDHAGMMQA